MIHGVIFDFDGLIADTEHISFQLYRDFLKTQNIELTMEQYILYCPGKPLITTLEFFKEHYHLSYTIEDAVDFFRSHEYPYMEKNGVALKKGVKKLLQYLKDQHIPICLATSSTGERARHILESHHILSYFDFSVFGNEVKQSKPFPDIFLKACDKMNIHVSNALVLEDSEAGIEAAYRANIRVICIPDLKHPGDKYAQMTTCIYPDLTYVIDYINNENTNS